MLPVSNQQEAKSFYLKLGFQVIAEAPAAHGQTWLQLALPGDNTSISLGNFHGIIFETDDLEHDIEDFKAKGILTKRTDTTPWGKFAWLADPDGNELCLHQKP